MVCHCSVPDGFPQPDTRVLHPATPPHPAKAMMPRQRRQLALEALAGPETVTARAVLNVELLPPDDPSRWPREAALPNQLGSRHFSLRVTAAEVARQTVRARSLVENLNSRLRNYFFLRRHLGSDYLALLQFFLNHRRFVRSERPERVGKSPAELTQRQPPPPLAGDAGLPPVLTQLTSRRQPSPRQSLPECLPGNAQGPRLLPKNGQN